MDPDVSSLVVNFEQTFNDLLVGVVVHPIALGDASVIFFVVRGFVKSTKVMLDFSWFFWLCLLGLGLV